MNPFETNTTPRQRREQRVIGAILARPWLLERAIAAGIDEELMREPGHRDVIRALQLVDDDTVHVWTSYALVESAARWVDDDALGGAPRIDGLLALKTKAEHDLGPGRWEDARALRMLLEDLEVLRERDLEADDLPMLAPPDAVIEDGQVGAKVDLDALEKTARAATQDEWAWRQLDVLEGRCNGELVLHVHRSNDPDLDAALVASNRDRAHIAANSPPVTLALIARIRELEAGAARATGRIRDLEAAYAIHIDPRDAETALDALLVRVRWYVTRRVRVPSATAVAFNALADALQKPTTQPWSRLP